MNSLLCRHFPSDFILSPSTSSKKLIALHAYVALK